MQWRVVRKQMGVGWLVHYNLFLLFARSRWHRACMGPFLAEQFRTRTERHIVELDLELLIAHMT